MKRKPRNPRLNPHHVVAVRQGAYIGEHNIIVFTVRESVPHFDVVRSLDGSDHLVRTVDDWREIDVEPPSYDVQFYREALERGFKF